MKPIKPFSHILLALSASCMVACGNSGDDFDATGVFEATEVTVSAKSTGELSAFTVKDGEKVEQNALVGVISTVNSN